MHDRLALIVPWLAGRVGQRVVLGLALMLVVNSAALAPWGPNGWDIAIVQLMERFSMGLAGVAIPALVAETMAGAGYAGGGLGGVMMAYGAGAALSPASAGLVAQQFAFPAAFLVFGAVAKIGILIWIIGLRVRTGIFRDTPETPSAKKAA